MQFIPHANFVTVRLNRAKQKERKEKEGSLFVVIDNNSEARNLQIGEIVGLGINVKHLFPQAKIGDTAILHWMVESKEKNNLVYQDETFNYYLATATECNGRVNEVYGIFDGENIIPSPEYIFLELPHSSVNTATTPDEYIEKATEKSEGGLLLFKEWVETRTDKEQKMAKISANIQSLTKSKMNEGVKQGIKEKERELAEISEDINKQRVEFYRIAAINPDSKKQMSEIFEHEINIGDKIGVLNIACQTTITLNGTEYIVCLSKHIHCTHEWATKSIRRFKEMA